MNYHGSNPTTTTNLGGLRKAPSGSWYFHGIRSVEGKASRSVAELAPWLGGPEHTNKWSRSYRTMGHNDLGRGSGGGSGDGARGDCWPRVAV